MSGILKFLLFAIFCIVNSNADKMYLDCSYLDPVNCKLEFREQFEKGLRVKILDLIKKLATQNTDYVKEVLKEIPYKEVERREELEKLVSLYNTSLQEAIESQNDTRKLFLTISGGSRFQNFNLTSLLGKDHADQFNKNILKEVDKFNNSVGNLWLDLCEGLSQEDTKQFPHYLQISDEVRGMMKVRGLIKLDFFKLVLQDIFRFLNMSDLK